MHRWEKKKNSYLPSKRTLRTIKFLFGIYLPLSLCTFISVTHYAACNLYFTPPTPKSRIKNTGYYSVQTNQAERQAVWPFVSCSTEEIWFYSSTNLYETVPRHQLVVIFYLHNFIQTYFLLLLLDSDCCWCRKMCVWKLCFTWGNNFELKIRNRERERVCVLESGNIVRKKTEFCPQLANTYFFPKSKGKKILFLRKTLTIWSLYCRSIEVLYIVYVDFRIQSVK